jgi:hypothetical protein
MPRKLVQFLTRLRRKAFPVRIDITARGFDVYEGDRQVASVAWDDVDEIVAFKRDMLTWDLVCLEFVLRGRDRACEVNDDAAEFWNLVKHVKEVFPESVQDWERLVVKPAFATNLTVIFKRTRTDGSPEGGMP